MEQTYQSKVLSVLSGIHFTEVALVSLCFMLPALIPESERD